MKIISKENPNFLRSAVLPCLEKNNYTEKNLLVNFTLFIRKFTIFTVMLRYPRHVEFLLF